MSKLSRIAQRKKVTGCPTLALSFSLFPMATRPDSRVEFLGAGSPELLELRSVVQPQWGFTRVHVAFLQFQLPLPTVEKQLLRYFNSRSCLVVPCASLSLSFSSSLFLSLFFSLALTFEETKIQI